MVRAFIDTNVILDVLLHRDDFYIPAAQIMALAKNRKISAIVSPITFINAVYIAKKYGVAATDMQRSLRLLIDFLDVALLDKTVMVDSLSHGFKDFEDATQYTCAINSKSDCIVTRNKKDFITDSINIFTPTEFISYLRHE